MAARLNPVEIIIKKRNGETLSSGEIVALVEGFMAGRISDYQMSAWLMAALLKGLDASETLALTDAMLHSGRVLRLASVRAPKVDKHSTGGVGDKISLCLAPLVAACGVSVPMISGRGLGHTGGTLDKLESIAGYDTRLDERRFESIVREVGVSIIGQTARLAPADRRMYALRDVTGTVESIPLIVASILSKKLAEGVDGLVFDVKAGRGAFMKDRAAARELARALVRIASRAGKTTSALLTDMSAPIGWSIGNALEVREAIEVLQGGGPTDTVELTVELGAEMLRVAGVSSRRDAGRAALRRAIASGAGLDRFRRMVERHGGDPKVADDVGRLPRAPHRLVVEAQRSGYVSGIDALELGLIGVALGAGRTRADEDVDHAVGIELAARVGDRIERGQPLAWLHVRRRAGFDRLAERARGAHRIESTRPRANRRVIERVR